MNLHRSKKRRRDVRTVRLPAPASAPPSAFAELIAARERQLAWTREFAAASDVVSALEAFLDADAISAELLE